MNFAVVYWIDTLLIWPCGHCLSELYQSLDQTILVFVITKFNRCLYLIISITKKLGLLQDSCKNAWPKYLCIVTNQFRLLWTVIQYKYFFCFWYSEERMPYTLCSTHSKYRIALFERWPKIRLVIKPGLILKTMTSMREKAWLK